MRALTFVFFFFFSTSAFSAPEVFGLEITGQCNQIQETYSDAQETGTNKYTEGPQFLIPVSSINFEGLTNFVAICDDEGSIAGFFTKFRKQPRGATFKKLLGYLRQNYQLEDLESPHVGDRKAFLSSGSIVIKLIEPHMSRRTIMTYKTEAFEKTFNEKFQEERRREKEREADSL